MNPLKHIGAITNTGNRVVIVFMQIPNRESHALCIQVNSLPPRFEQNVMTILESKGGQAAENLADELSRQLMSDTGKTVLQALHEQNLLIPIPVSNITMYPEPNFPFPLEQLLKSMGRSVPPSNTQPISQTPTPTPTVPSLAETNRFNPYIENLNAHNKEGNSLLARNLIIEAEMLEADAAIKREKARQISQETTSVHDFPSTPVNTVSVLSNSKIVPNAETPINFGSISRADLLELAKVIRGLDVPADVTEAPPKVQPKPSRTVRKKINQKVAPELKSQSN